MVFLSSKIKKKKILGIWSSTDFFFFLHIYTLTTGADII